MTLPSSGTLALSDIYAEINGSHTSQTVSLRSMASAAGMSSPDAVSEFYGYSHGPSLGLSPVLLTIPAQDNAAWTYREVSPAALAPYVGATVRVVFKVTQPNPASFDGDLQIDDINIAAGFYDPEASTYSFQRDSTAATSAKTDYNAIVWTALTTATAGNGLWLRDSGGTTSSGTGNTTGNTGSYYYYTETSGSGQANAVYWLRSPQVPLGSAVISFYSAQNGPSCGKLEILLDVISI